MANAESYRPSVLLVDDTPSNLVALSVVLQPLPLRLVEARSGAEAVEHVGREPFAVVLLDVQMPDMDGFETARRIRELPSGREVPIVFLTAIHCDEQDARRGYQAGAADYITKPFDVEVVRARVRAFVDLYRQREEAHRERYEARTQELDQAARRIDAFERIATAALATDDIHAFLHMLLTVFIGAADSVEMASILLRDADRLTARASIGLQEEVEAGFSVRVGEGFVGKVAATAGPLLLVGDEIATTVLSEWLKKRGLQALYGVPMMTDGEVTGVALIGSSTAQAFSPSETALFRAMVARAAWVVTRQTARFLLDRGLDTAPVGISIWRAPEFVCEYANAEYRRQYAGRDPVGSPLERPEFRATFADVVRTGETYFWEEYPLSLDWDGDGLPELRFFKVSLHPLRAGLAPAASVLALTIDTTNEVLARRALAKGDADRARLLELERAARRDAEIANRAKDEFLATISHELRTPLNAILGWVTSARQGAIKDIDRALGVIERNARAQARIVEDVLDLSRTVSGKLRLDIVSSNISRAIFGAAEAVRPSAETKNIRFEVHVADDLGIVAADPDRIQQVVWNLLTNAVKFTPEGGQVTVTGTNSGGKVLVRVEDSGQGIAPEFLPYVFDPFRQADASTTRRHGGVGLGLAIVKQLVQAHGGTIRAASEGVGRGAAFTMELPARAVPGLGPPSSDGFREADASVVRLDAMRVLVVDDEEDSRILVRELLAARGARVVVAGSADEAMRHMAAFRPHVLVSDIGMPEVDGYTLIRNVRALPPEMGGDTPAIALTAYARSEDRRRAVNEGFQMHVAKPVDPSELLIRVADLARMAS
jgi:signal transduction histidine kinase/DNA-binding response OmpR family regulator